MTLTLHNPLARGEPFPAGRSAASAVPVGSVCALVQPVLEGIRAKAKTGGFAWSGGSRARQLGLHRSLGRFLLHRCSVVYTE